MLSTFHPPFWHSRADDVIEALTNQDHLTLQSDFIAFSDSNHMQHKTKTKKQSSSPAPAFTYELKVSNKEDSTSVNREEIAMHGGDLVLNICKDQGNETFGTWY